MREKGLDEDPIEQMCRLFTDFLARDAEPATDQANRIRLDDREMRPDVQAEVAALWPQVTTENLRDAHGLRRISAANSAICLALRSKAWITNARSRRTPNYSRNLNLQQI